MKSDIPFYYRYWQKKYPLTSAVLALTTLLISSPSYALHIQPVFTSGPCPIGTPTDDVCPGGASQCPVFHDPSLVPAGYTSVTYCSKVMGVIGFGFDPTSSQQFVTMPLNAAEQAAWITAAKRIESYVKDDVTLVFETYKNGSISPGASVQSSSLVALATEFFTPVCMSDLLLPPYSKSQPTIVYNPPPAGTYSALTDPTLGTYSYVGIPQTYDTFVKALQAKNSQNTHKFPLIASLPSADKINVEWSSTFNYTKADSNIDQNSVKDGFWLNSFYNLNNGPTIVGTNGGSILYPPGPAAGTKPLTVCTSPANAKALGLVSKFNTKNFTFADINNPAHNPWVTVPGTDGAMTMANFADAPADPAQIPFVVHTGAPQYFSWILDPTSPAILSQQLPIAYYTTHNLAAKTWGACDDPTQCAFPKGFDHGIDFVATVEHELHHLMGVMTSEYYKQALEGNGMAAAYANALFAYDLFELDGNAVATQSGDPWVNPNGQGILQSASDWAKAPRNLESNFPVFNGTGSTNVYYNANGTNLVSPYPATPWIQFGQHDHLFVYLDSKGKFQYFPLQNYSIYNPDGDTQYTAYKKVSGYNSAQDTCVDYNYVYKDPRISQLNQLDRLDTGVQANAGYGIFDVPTDREFMDLSALGWDVDPSSSNTIQYATPSLAPTAAWYTACFASDGTFLKNGVNGHTNCVFSVLPDDIAKINQ